MKLGVMCTAQLACAVGLSAACMMLCCTAGALYGTAAEYMMLCCTAGALYGTAVIILYYCSRNVTLKMAQLPVETCR
jgi:hypothetical protein